jgi:predicted nucleic acid-binding protein
VSFVLDNSVALAWCFEDEQTDAVLALLDRVVSEGAVAPPLWPVEALNGLLTAERRGRIDAASRRQLFDLLSQLPIELDDEMGRRAWTATAAMAEQYGLTAYDAAYLELAARRRLPLATRDEALIKAAATAGVDLI